MADDWSREEVEAAVADYLEMLHAERAGIPYNKSEHRRTLARLLNARSDGSIERKHQNISAVLIELGMPYVEGYKPLRNYQQLLFEVVAAQVENRPDLRAALSAEAIRPATLPTVDDILNALVAPPKESAREPIYTRVRESPVVRLAVDYLALEASNRSLGVAGEELAVRFEQARLAAANQERLAAAVERVSATRGDGVGFDVLSFDVDGRERFVEVKTTAYGPATPFFVTRNEITVSQRSAAKYHLYRIFGFRTQPRLYQKAGQIDHAFSLDAVQFLARVRDA
jgi:hypothetical protein